MLHVFSVIWLSRYHLSPHFCQSCQTVSLCFYGQNISQILENLFHAFLNVPINKKNGHSPKKTLAGPIKGGGVKGRYDRGQKFNVFLKAFLSYGDDIFNNIIGCIASNGSFIVWQKLALLETSLYIALTLRHPVPFSNQDQILK